MKQKIDSGNVSDRLRKEALDLNLFLNAQNYAFEYMKNILDRSVYLDKITIDGLIYLKNHFNLKGQFL